MKDKLSKILPAFVALGIIGFTAFSIWQSRQTKDKIIMTQPEKLQITEVWQVVSVDSPTGFTIKKGWFDSRKNSCPNGESLRLAQELVFETQETQWQFVITYQNIYISR
jgi:hypothetical protein